MTTMALSHENKVTARTSAEVAQGVRQLVLRQAGRGLKFGRKVIGIEGVIGCILLDVLAMEEEEQDAIIDEWLDTLAAQTGKQTRRSATAPPVEEKPIVEEVVSPTVSAAKRRRKA